MPPKGWRKNAEGAYPATTKERDSISIDDILFPKATVNRLARAIIPDGGNISKDSSTAVQRSATVFVNYLLVYARQNAKKFDRKTVGPQDVLAALEEAEFSSFIPSVKQELDIYQAHKDALKLKRKEEKEKNAALNKKKEQEEEGKQQEQEEEEQEQSQQIDIDQAQSEKDQQDPDEQNNDENDDEDTQDAVDESIEEQKEEEGPDSKRLKTREDTVSEEEK